MLCCQLLLGLPSLVYAQNPVGSPTGRLTMGLDYSVGDYGLSDSTQMLYLPVKLTYDSFPWRLAVTASYLSMQGPGGVVGGGDGGGIVPGEDHQGSGHGRKGGQGGCGHGGQGPGGKPGGCGKITTEQGLGDTILEAGLALDSFMNTAVALDLIGKIKLPTADEDKELGTGEQDYSLQLDMAWQYGKILPYASLGYKLMGSSQAYQLEDGWFGTAGFNYKVSTEFSWGSEFEAREPVSASSEGVRELVTYINWKTSSDWSINSYAVFGFSDGSPDAGIGIQLTYRQ